MFSTTTHDEFYVQVTNTGLAYTLIGGFVVVVSPSTFVLLDFFGLQNISIPFHCTASPQRLLHRTAFAVKRSAFA